MNYNQSELFQKVLEQMETNLQENLNSFVQDYYFDDAQECLDGLRHIGAILENYDDKIDRDDMDWTIDELFKTGKEEDFEIGADFIKAINDDLEICTDEEVKSMIDELLDM